MFSSLIVTTPPDSEPVNVDDVKTQLRLDGDEQNTMIEALISSARQAVETILKKKILSTGVRAGFDSFKPFFCLPLAPVLSIDSIKYFDPDGIEQTLSSDLYNTDIESSPARIQIKNGCTFPQTENRPGAVKVNYTCGYSAEASSVPASIKQAIIAIAIDLFEHPEMSPEIVLRSNKTIQFLLNSHKNTATVM